MSQTTHEESVESMDTETLIETLGDRDLAKRYEAADRLLEEADSSLPRLIEALKADNYHVRAGAAFALGRMGAGAREALADLEKARDEDTRGVVRDAAAFAIDAIIEADSGS